MRKFLIGLRPALVFFLWLIVVPSSLFASPALIGEWMDNNKEQKYVFVDDQIFFADLYGFKGVSGTYRLIENKILLEFSVPVIGTVRQFCEIRLEKQLLFIKENDTTCDEGGLFSRWQNDRFIGYDQTLFSKKDRWNGEYLNFAQKRHSLSLFSQNNKLMIFLTEYDYQSEAVLTGIGHTKVGKVYAAVQSIHHKGDEIERVYYFYEENNGILFDYNDTNTSNYFSGFLK